MTGLRTSSNIRVPRSTTESFNLSHTLPSTIRDWNKLPRSIGNFPTLEQFKDHIMPVKQKIPDFIQVREDIRYTKRDEIRT